MLSDSSSLKSISNDDDDEKNESLSSNLPSICNKQLQEDMNISPSILIRNKRKRPRLQKSNINPNSPLSNSVKTIPKKIILHNRITEIRNILRKEMEGLCKIKEIHSLNLKNTIFIIQQLRHQLKSTIIKGRDDLMMRIAIMISESQNIEDMNSSARGDEIQLLKNELSLLKIEHHNVSESLLKERTEREKGEDFHTICQEDWEKTRILLERKLKKTSTALKDVQGTPKHCHNCISLGYETERLLKMINNQSFLEDLKKIEELRFEKNLSLECQDLKEKLAESQSETNLLMDKLSSSNNEISSLQESFNVRLDSNLSEMLKLKEDIALLRETERLSLRREEIFKRKLIESLNCSIVGGDSGGGGSDDANIDESIIFDRLQELKEPKKELYLKMEMEKMRERFEKEKRLLNLRIEDLQDEGE